MFTDLEKKILAFILEEPPDYLLSCADRSITLNSILILREQWIHTSFLRREWTGSGFFTYFQMPKDLRLVEPPNFYIDIAKAEIAGLKLPVEFILWIEKGKLSYLEGFAYENWQESMPVLAIYKANLTGKLI